MKAKIIYGLGSLFTLLIVFVGCSDPEYSIGELAAPTNIVINTEVIGQSDSDPYGDGSGDVKISVDADNALAYKIDFGTSPEPNFVPLTEEVTKKYTATGVNDYIITIVAYGAGGTATNVTKEITVSSQFNPDPKIVEDLTGDGSKTWVIDRNNGGHFGVGPYDNASTTPEWYSATANEKADCCGCFYSASFTFNKSESGDYTIAVATPDGAFTKTGDLTNIPGIPAAGDEGCYDYVGATSAFSFAPSSTGISDSQTAIVLANSSTFIGYGAVLDTYEILEITPDTLYLRVQGTETGNAWYLRLVPAV
ncbi:hypothetical protein [Christiangramia echinicola]|uniref:PKD domain-containing protein n=1 Tax=Christiangramia echinicola TaxID=279359 RepID=A0A1H1MKG9_9FLAO|nr:hypothetical protein [Christiangramia echinicola]SDR87248.1 hypothetical protein SAMN04488552_1345 [Christiangramia echinicola]